MKIIYLHQYFYTPDMVGVAGARSYELGRRLVAAGHQVDVVTSATHAPSEKGEWFVTEEVGMRVHWIPIPYSNKMNFRRRLRAFLRFARGAGLRAASLEADVIYATSGPLTIALPAIYTAILLRKPLVFEVRDLWPEGAIQLGVLKNPASIAAARALERLAYAFSRHIVALSPGMRDGIVRAGTPRKKITVIPNACDLELFHPGVDGSAMREKFQLQGKFSLAYFGTMGLANGLDYLLDAALELKRRNVKDVVLILHGDGMERAALEQRAQREGLENVVFADPVPEKRKIAELAAAVDICMTIYKNVPVLATCSPNKLFDTLAAGKPVLVNMPGDLQRLVEENRCGLFTNPDDPKDFADKVLALRDDPARLAEFGANARRLGERVFSRDVLAGQLEAILDSVAKTGVGPTPPLEQGWA